MLCLVVSLSVMDSDQSTAGAGLVLFVASVSDHFSPSHCHSITADDIERSLEPVLAIIEGSWDEAGAAV